MFDARFAAFAALSALLVISPGATLAVVVETALGYGRKAALLTVVGVGLANAALAAAAALGLSALVGHWPSSLHVVRVAGGAYLAYLGVRGLWRAVSCRRPAAERETGPGPSADSATRRDPEREKGPGPVSLVGRGMLTNLLNPPVILFYMTVVPQFIGPQDGYLARAFALGATHVAMSVVWQGSCGMAVGSAAEHMRRPAVRRILEGVTGAVLVLLGARLLL
ncbi:MAG: LysE family translocator [Vicinamibacterales bacterium]